MLNSVVNCDVVCSVVPVLDVDGSTVDVDVAPSVLDSKVLDVSDVVSMFDDDCVVKVESDALIVE